MEVRLSCHLLSRGIFNPCKKGFIVKVLKFNVKSGIITPKQNKRTSSGSAADSSSIHFRFICTVKQIQEIIQILT